MKNYVRVEGELYLENFQVITEKPPSRSATMEHEGDFQTKIQLVLLIEFRLFMGLVL